MSWRRDLLWFFANGHRVTQLSSVGVPDGGIRGSGNSGTKGTFSNWDYDPEDLVKFGAISRRLGKVTESQRVVLERAYGDAGMAATECCLYPQRRWRALAFLTPACRERSGKFKRARPKGASEAARDVTAGPACVHYANDLLGKKEPSLADREALRAIHAESLALLADAEGAFAALYEVAPCRSAS